MTLQVCCSSFSQTLHQTQISLSFLQRAATMFIYSNYEEESPTSGSVCRHALLHLLFTPVWYRRWQEWDWNLTFSEFNQTILRIADLKLANSQVQNSYRVVFSHHLTKA
jgi:hypothetical protein